MWRKQEERARNDETQINHPVKEPLPNVLSIENIFDTWYKRVPAAGEMKGSKEKYVGLDKALLQRALRLRERV